MVQLYMGLGTGLVKRRLNCVELQELGLLQKNQAISKKWSSMKCKIKKLFVVDF